MKLTVKTLKGGKFEVDCEGSSTVLQVKGFIVSRARMMSLIDCDRWLQVQGKIVTGDVMFSR
jgi:hypothetical protein